MEGERALEWVEEHNAATLAELEAHPAFQPILDRTVEILDADDRIAFPSILGDRIYNFWQDEDHPRGIWRRTTWDSYLSGEPQWETVLDIDSLAAAEDVNWSYSGTSCMPPGYRMCLVRLSRGGADAVEIREFDAERKQFVEGGFFLPEAKQSVAWVDRDALLVATNFGEGSLTTSGYARIAKLWQRDTPLSAAETLFEGEPSDVSVGVGSFLNRDSLVHVVFHRPRFFEGTMYMLRDGELAKVDVPLDADANLLEDQIVVYLRSPWEVGGRTYPGGVLIAMSYDEFMAGERDFEVIVQPGERETIRGTSMTRDYLLVSMLNNVRGELRRYRHEDGRWTFETVPAAEMGSIYMAPHGCAII